MIGKEQSDWVGAAWHWLHTEIKPGQRVFIPAGGTPTQLYRRLVREPSTLWKTLRLIQLDEIISGPKAGIFRRFFETELAPFQSQMEWIDRADQRADIAILGVGVNGHVAFHEPGLPRDFTSGCVRLAPETRSYLELQDPTWGLTYGVGTFLQAEKILVLAQGPAKKEVLKRALRDRNLPISWIMEHPKVTLISDFEL